MPKYYRDGFGCTAKISEVRSGGHRLKIAMPDGGQHANKVYTNEPAAIQALRRFSPDMEQVKGQERGRLDK